MVAFEVIRRTQLSADAAWRRLTDWRRHGDFIPLTDVRVMTQGLGGVGTILVARTSMGPLAFDDPMEVSYWRPPTGHTAGICRIVKLGRVVTGWAALTVTPQEATKAGQSTGRSKATSDTGGATIRWVEQAQFRVAGPLLNWPNAVAGKYVFGRLVDGLLGEDASPQ